MPYEEIDHHADVMFHVWGDSFDLILKDSLNIMTSVFFGRFSSDEFTTELRLRWKSLQNERIYETWLLWMALLDKTPARRLPKKVFYYEFTVTSSSVEDLLYQVLDEYLYLFATENVFCLGMRFELNESGIGTGNTKILRCCLKKIPVHYAYSLSGIEVKAVTKHNLRVIPPQDHLTSASSSLWNAWFVLDI